MSLNTSLQYLYSSSNLVERYTQTFNFLSGFATDSAYIDHVEMKNNMIIISFPDPINIISNICVRNAKYKIMYNDMQLNFNTINLKKYKNCKLVIYDIVDYNLVNISYDVYLMKKQLLSCL